MKKFLFLFAFITHFEALYSKDFFSFYYSDSSFEYSRYSFSYARVLSTNFVVGLGFDLVDSYYKTNYLKSVFEFGYSNFSFSFKPFYFFKDNNNLYGGKFSFSFVNSKDEVLTTYGLILSYAKEKKHSFSYFNFFIEKNFYDEFFIVLQPGLSLKNDSRFSAFDITYLFNTSYNGFVNSILYSSFSLSFARSFKPDFNSYLYINFDRLNSTPNNTNSYTIGLRAYLDENSQYYLDFSYNIADHKDIKNENIWRFSLGGIL